MRAHLQCRLRPFVLLVAAGTLVGFAAVEAPAKVHGSGPSDSSLFDTVISRPSDPGFIHVLGGVEGETVQFNLYDGAWLGHSVIVQAGSEVNIYGGLVHEHLRAQEAEINILGGQVSDFFLANRSEVNIRGGTVGSITVYDSKVSISGGALDDSFRAYSSEVNLFGTDFALDGVSLVSMIPGETRVIADRDILITGTLADGSPLEFELSRSVFNPISLSSSVLTLTLIPEPASLAMLGPVLLCVMQRRWQRARSLRL